MIISKKELQFYLMADRIMSGYEQRMSFTQFVKFHIKRALGGGILTSYLYPLRKTAYYANVKGENSMLFKYWNWKLRKAGIKFGFSIGYNSLGYGVVIPHWGTIVVNPNSRIGNFAVLQTSTCIAGGGKVIGDGLYLAVGSQIVGKLTLGNNVTIASHSMVNKSFGDNVLLVGAPAFVKKDNWAAWYKNQDFEKKVEQIKQLRLEWFGNE